LEGSFEIYLQFLIIDEISMVSYDLFSQIEMRLRELKDGSKLFEI
jgi:hypothetical protein